MYMIMFVLDDTDRLDSVLDAWNAIGVSGVTIMETSGSYRRQRPTITGARYAFGRGMGARSVELGQYTLFVIVPGEAAVQACIAAAESIVGDLSQPNTGVLASWKLGLVKGVPGTLRQPGEDSE